MPFISEEIFQYLDDRKDEESIMIAKMPKVGSINQSSLQLFDEAKEIITSVRNIRQEKNIPNKESISLQIASNEQSYKKDYLPIIKKLAFIDSIDFVDKTDDSASSFRVKTMEYAVPLGDLINIEEERQKLEEELKYQKGFLNSVLKKLHNERFVSNAPEIVVKKERQKQADAEIKIKAIEEQLNKLKN
jgi:valyl-tRNA synthetase